MVPNKLGTQESYVFTKDYNKTSIKKINRKVIKKTRENPMLKSMSVKDFLIMCAILKDLIVKKKTDELCDLLKPYKFLYLKEIESVISIDKLEKGSVSNNDVEISDLEDEVDEEGPKKVDTYGKVKNKYKIKGKMKSVMTEKLNLQEEEKKKGAGKKGAGKRAGRAVAQPPQKRGPKAKGRSDGSPKTPKKSTGSKSTRPKKAPVRRIEPVRVVRRTK
jgi:hypothetical protein